MVISLFKRISLLGSSQAIIVILSFLTQSIIARSSESSLLGEFDYLMIALSFGTNIIIFGIDSALGVFISDNSQKFNINYLLSASFVIQVAISIIVSFAFILSLERAPSGYLQSFNLPIVFVILLLLSTVILENIINIFLWAQFVKYYAIAVLSSPLIYLCMVLSLSLYDYCFPGCIVLDLNSLFVSYLVSRLVSVLIGIVLLVKSKLWASFEWPPRKYYISLLMYAWPFGIYSFLTNIVPLAQRSYILKYLGASDLGYFSLASRVASVVLLIQVTFHSFWTPLFVSKSHKKIAKSLFRLTLKVVSLCVAIIIPLFALFSSVFVNFIGGEHFQQSVPCVLALVIVNCLSLVENVAGIGCAMAKNSLPYLLSIFASFIPLLMFSPHVLSLFAIQYYAWFLSVLALIRFVVLAYFSHLVYPVDHGYSDSLFLVCSSFSLGLLFAFCPPMPTLFSFVVLVATWAFMIILFFVRLSNLEKGLIGQYFFKF
jgi:O-antigen/teichoic acid export membrane protein